MTLSEESFEELDEAVVPDEPCVLMFEIFDMSSYSEVKQKIVKEGLFLCVVVPMLGLFIFSVLELEKILLVPPLLSNQWLLIHDIFCYQCMN